MFKISWRQVFPWLLPLSSSWDHSATSLPRGSIYEEYVRWGYPHWFHFVTGSLELTTAVLLAFAPSRLLGSALGCAVMFAALGIVLINGEYGHAVPPLVVAGLSIVVGWMTWRKRLSKAEA